MKTVEGEGKRLIGGVYSINTHIIFLKSDTTKYLDVKSVAMQLFPLWHCMHWMFRWHDDLIWMVYGFLCFDIAVKDCFAPFYFCCSVDSQLALLLRSSWNNCLSKLCSACYSFMLIYRKCILYAWKDLHLLTVCF